MLHCSTADAVIRLFWQVETILDIRSRGLYTSCIQAYGDSARQMGSSEQPALEQWEARNSRDRALRSLEGQTVPLLSNDAGLNLVGGMVLAKCVELLG